MSALVQVSATYLLTLMFSVCAEEFKKKKNSTINLSLVVMSRTVLGFVCFRLMVMSC